MKAYLRPVLAAALLALAPAAVLAQTAPSAPADPTQTPAAAPATAPATETAKGKAGRRGGRFAACRGDIQTLCPDAKRGERRKCLDTNAAKLSPACTAAITEMRSAAKAMRQACEGDVATLCADTKGKGGGGVGRCLRANEAKLSPDCGAALKARGHRG